MRLVVFAFALLALIAPAQASPYALNNTDVVPFLARDSVHRFNLFISLPRDYDEQAHERFPVIYLLDADYAFAIAHNTLRHFTDRNQLTEAIIIGIAYPGADGNLDVYKRTRVRDYTPSRAIGASGYGDEIDKQSGSAAAFLRVLDDELIPFVDTRYRTRSDARTLVGHSYGALFACWTMLARPGLFQDYIIVSPSLWYDNHMVLDLAKQFVATHRALPAHVFFGVGSFEGQGSMAADMKAFDAELTAAHLDGYNSALMVFEGETHNSVFPAAFTRGLRVLNGFKGENGPVTAPGSK